MPDSKGKGNVLKNGKVGKKRIILKNGIHLPPVGGKVKHVGAVYDDRSVVGVFKPRDYPQKGCFSAPGRPQKGKKLTLVYLKAYIIQSRKITEGFGNPPDDHIAAFQCFSSSLLSKSLSRKNRPSYYYKRYNEVFTVHCQLVFEKKPENLK
jgi:hypothetical protein